MSGLLRLLGPNLGKTVVSADLAPHQRITTLTSTWQSIQLNSNIEDKWKRQDKLVPEITALGRLWLDECVRTDTNDPRGCLQFALQKGVFYLLITIAIKGPATVTRTVVNVFSELIEVQDDDFLSHEAISWNLSILFKWFSQKSEKATLFSSMIQLHYVSHPEIILVRIELIVQAICVKIRLCPQLMPMFFDAVSWQARCQQSSGASNKLVACVKPEREDFLLYALLKDNIREFDHVGELCRVGLLYLVDATKNNQGLLRWFLNSDLVLVLSEVLRQEFVQQFDPSSKQHRPSGFHKLDSTARSESSGAAGGFYATPTNIFNVDIQHLDDFQHYLLYWQDIYRTVEKGDIRCVLLKSYQTLFLETILMPHLLQVTGASNPPDVCLQLNSLLSVLRQPEIVQVTIAYLCDAQDLEKCSTFSELFTHCGEYNSAATEQKHSQISLKACLLRTLKSTNQSYRTSSLLLLHTLVVCHWRYAAVLFGVTKSNHCRAPFVTDYTSVLQVLGDMDHMSKSVSSNTQSNNGYEHDAEVRLARGYRDLITDQSVLRNVQHILQSTDSLLQELMLYLSQFFTNTVALNMILTKVLIDLCTSPHQSLYGWVMLKNDFDNEHRTDCDRESKHVLLRHMEAECFHHHEPLINDSRSVDRQTSIAAQGRQCPSMMFSDGIDAKVDDTSSPLLSVLQGLCEKFKQYTQDEALLKDFVARRASLEIDLLSKFTVKHRDSARAQTTGLGVNCDHPQSHAKMVLLSSDAKSGSLPLIDNLIIFEEFIKELMATIKIRGLLYMEI